jgi:hypothetical protein
MIELQKEEQLLNEAYRKSVIDKISQLCNTRRKAELKKRHEIYKDQTKKHVIQEMIHEAEDPSIKKEIEARTSNVSIGRKIWDKKAMIYKDGARREASEESKQKQVDSVIDMMDFNQGMKKTNRYSEIFRNVLTGVLPYKNQATEKYYLKLSPTLPYQMDVLVDSADKERAVAVVIPYEEETEEVISGEASLGKRNGKNETVGTISKAERYIWWSTKYHFTTDAKGQIIPSVSPEGLLNPIQMFPFVDFSKLKDGKFWNDCGADIGDGSVLINVLLTDMYWISKYQGMGLGYIFGKGVPQNVKVGASSFVSVQMEAGDPTPSIGFASSNPPIDSHIRQIEQHLAMLLSTNNLEAGTIAGTLSAQNITSGVQEIVKRAENMDEITDQQETYRDGEPMLFKIAFAWLEKYKGHLEEGFDKIAAENMTNVWVSVKFNTPSVYTSEKEKLDIIEKRMDLGLDDLIDSILRDNPELTKEQAEEKAKRMQEQKEIKYEVDNGRQSDIQAESEESGS